MAERLATLLGGREAIDREHDLLFTRSIGYLTKATVLDDKQLFEDWFSEFEELCEDEYYMFEGLGKTLYAILDHNVYDAIEGVERIAKDHSVLAKQRAWYAGSADELLSVNGIGAANLARHRGLDVPAVPPLIPEDLLI